MIWYLDGSFPTDRMARYCNIDGTWAESMCFGLVSATEVVERLIVDDGQAKRGNRKNVFSTELRVCGVHTGNHSSRSNVIVMEFAGVLLKDGEMPSMDIQV